MALMVWIDPNAQDIREATATGVVRVGQQYLALEFDATLGEEHSASAEVTEHPVEEGVPISDHVKPAPARLAMQALVTNTPLNSVLVSAKVNASTTATVAPILLLNHPEVIQIDTQRQLQPGRVILPAVSPFKFPGIKRASSPAQAFPGTWVTDANFLVARVNGSQPYRQDRVKTVFDALNDLILWGTPVKIITDLRTYEQMVLTSVTAPVKPEDAIAFSLEFKEFRTVSTRNVNITRKVKKPAEKRAEEPVNEGPKGPGYPPPDENALRSDILRLSDYFR